MSAPSSQPVELALDEMFSPKIAEVLRERGHTVVAVVERLDLRAMTDDDLYTWATAERHWLLTENAKDFRPIMLRALQSDSATAGLLFTSSRTFLRSRHNPAPLIEAVHAWLLKGPPAPPLTEDWLFRATD
ncbi:MULTISPECIES: DUF5615 family PIN-like protein [Protofrankia]|uniref:DUF5615 domain-containing protein n=1 Tax=Candidatus Protofrankia datiscae TaxID=2716812 RepID=F8B1Q3_9ACTN|nr:MULTISPECIES: DUF5615 family PIN-like protein [Protofrankia]AEH08222.1 hypothetical protein FsymDg_0699 [Candidatus Protofrankia datiscae]